MYFKEVCGASLRGFDNDMEKAMQTRIVEGKCNKDYLYILLRM